MEQDQRTCPSCGSPTGDYAFCQSCRSHMDSLAGVPIRAASQATSLAVQTDGATDQTSVPPPTSTVQVEADPRPAADAATLKLPSTPARVGDIAPPARDVARLEDVLSIDSREHIAARTVAGAAPTVEPAQEEAVETPEVSPDDILERAKRELDRLEALLRPASTDFEGRIAAEADAVVEPAAAPARKPVELRVSRPMYVAAHKLRAAFLYEQTAAFEQAASLEPQIEEEPVASVPPPAPAPTALTSVPPPSQPAPQPEAPSPAPVQAPRNHHWLTAVCLLALIALVVVLTGRRPCGCAEKPH